MVILSSYWLMKSSHERVGIPKTPYTNIRIAFSGDTQRNYAKAKAFVDNVNTRNDIDFVILNGDISDFGLLAEFDYIYDIYAQLKVPFVCIIGNHDLVAILMTNACLPLPARGVNQGHAVAAWSEHRPCRHGAERPRRGASRSCAGRDHSIYGGT